MIVCLRKAFSPRRSLGRSRASTINDHLYLRWHKKKAARYVLPFYIIILPVFFLCIQRIHHNIGIGVSDDRFISVVDDHAGFAVGDLLNLLDRGHIHRNVLTAGGLGVVGCQLSSLGDGVIGRCGAAAGDDDMGAVNLACVAPDVIFSGQLEGQFIILPVVPTHIDGVAVGGLKAEGRKAAAHAL